MSRLAALVRAVDTGQRSAANFTAVTSLIGESRLLDILTHYRIQVVFGSQVAVRADSGELEEAIRRTKQGLIEEVFGEFREPLNLIRQAMYARDDHKAHQLIDALHDQMFRLDK